ncbi:MAG TPA: ABC transporter substrate-binding protein [Gemmatimonadales bacterium]|nr:ABC transporter substrate-binding protein [Gemmatimonadales bacterium]
MSVFLVLGACEASLPRRAGTVLYASGAELQSINPLLTVHPLARQVQRYVLLTTLVRYDSTLVPEPYLARRWAWSADRRVLTMHLTTALRWHDGAPTTARDAAWTLEAARDPATGYPRATDLADLSAVRVRDDSTLILEFRAAQNVLPDVLTDLAILPRHLLDSVPRGRLRLAAWNRRPVGNGPFRFVTHEPNRRWVFERNPDFPAELGGAPRIQRLVIAVVDEPMTKLAALVSGELDVAGVNPAHAAFVRKDPRLVLLDYPLLFNVGIVFNARRPPFHDPLARRRVEAALDRREIVDGYLFGFATPADGPVPPDLPGYIGDRPPRPTGSGPGPSGPGPLAFELLTVGSGEAALEQLVQAQLARAGIAARVRQLELGTFLDQVYGPRHDFEAAVLGVPGDLGLGYLRPLAALSGLPAPDDAAQLQRFFRDSAAAAFLYHARGVQGMNRRLQGVRMDVRGELVTVARWTVVP